jgi:hypothetical protein
LAVHVHDIRMKSGRGDDFIELFNKFDYEHQQSVPPLTG